jgi:hypothetical protein
MAKFFVSGMDEIMDEINRRTQKALDKIPKMLEASGAVLVEAQRFEAFELDIKDSGEMIGSISATEVKKDEDGNQYIDVYPQGKDSKNVSNELKGFIAEYGRMQDPEKAKPRKSKKDGEKDGVKVGVWKKGYKYSSLAPRPWMAAAKEKAAGAIGNAQRKVWEEEE